MKRYFFGGPRHGTIDFYPSPSPPMWVRVYADPPEGMTCADEQVIEYLGKYIRDEFRDEDFWLYRWEENENRS